MFPKPKKSSKSLDTSMLPFPKTRRVKSQKTIDKTRKRTCEISGHTQGLHQHHIVPKGAGGPDIKENLITLDAENHAKAHNVQISRDELWGIVARREGKTVDEIRRIVATAMGREYI